MGEWKVKKCQRLKHIVEQKKDFIKASNEQKKNSKRFSNLLDLIASNFPQIRIRFSTSNPQDMTIDVLETIAKYNNICNYFCSNFDVWNKLVNYSYYGFLVVRAKNVTANLKI